MMRCPFSKQNRYCTNSHSFANFKSKQRTCAYKKNPRKCPLIKGTRFEKIFDKDYDKSSPTQLKTATQHYLDIDTIRILNLEDKKNAKD